jgi:hypothetical protein
MYSRTRFTPQLEAPFSVASHNDRVCRGPQATSEPFLGPRTLSTLGAPTMLVHVDLCTSLANTRSVGYALQQTVGARIEGNAFRSRTRLGLRTRNERSIGRAPHALLIRDRHQAQRRRRARVLCGARLPRWPRRVDGQGNGPGRNATRRLLAESIARANHFVLARAGQRFLSCRGMRRTVLAGERESAPRSTPRPQMSATNDN